MKYTNVINTLNAVTATTTGSAIDISDTDRIVLVMKRANHSAGSSAFSVEVSADGTNWITYNKLIDNVTNTNAQTLTRVASKSLASNTTAFVTMDPDDAFKFMRVTVTETTDGTHSAWVVLYHTC